jgi:NHS family xanthosine MFS transporter
VDDYPLMHFNISGSLFVETQTDSKIRASAQGLFMMMTNGFGTMIGAWTSGKVIANYFIFTNGTKDWQGIWITFAIYSLVIAVLFMFIFKHKHNSEELINIQR